MNRILIGAAVVLVLIAGTVLAGPGIVDWNRYRAQITAQVEEIVGRPVIIGGDIEFAALPALALAARNVHIVNPDGATAADLLSLESLEIRVAFVPLLRGEIQVRQVVLQKPVLEIEILADGRPNWFLAGANDGASPFGLGLAQGLSIDSFITRNGTVIYRDPANGILEHFRDVNAEITADALAGPYAARGTLSVRGIAMAFNFASGALDTGRPSALRLDLSLTESGDALGFQGAYADQGDNASLTGDLRVQGADFGASVRTLFRAWGAVPPRARGFGVPFSAQARTAWTPGDAGFNDLNLKLGSITGVGAVNVAFAPEPRFDATVALNRINVDAILVRAGEEPASVEAVLGIDPVFSLPPWLSGSLALGVEAISFRQRSVRQIGVEAEFGGGEVAISRASAQLPGVSQISATGALRAVDQKPQFDGDVSGRSDNLRDLMVWLGLDRSEIPADRLRTLAFEGKVRALPGLLQAYGFDLRFDTTRVSGAVGYAFRERPAFSVDVAVDRIDFDSYRRRPLPADAAQAREAVAEEGAPAGPPVWAVLQDFDTEIKFRLAELVYNDEQVRGIALDLGLLGGVLTVREAAVEDLAGATFSLTGIAGGFDGRVGGGGNVKISADDPTGLARLTNTDLGLSWDQLGPLVFNASVDGDQDKLTLDLGMTAGETDLWVRGGLVAIAEEPAMDVAFGAGHPSLTRALRALGLTGAEAGRPLPEGPVALRGTAAGTLADLQIELTGQVAGIDVGLVGSLGADEALAYRFQGSVSHESAAVMLAGFGIGPADARDYGPLRLRGAVDGNGQRAAVSGLQASLGPTEVTGDLAIAFAGERPRIEARLAATHVPLVRFLPQSAGRSPAGGEPAIGPAGGANGRRNWSVDPIHLDFLAAADVALDFEAEGMEAWGYAFEEPVLKAQSRDGSLEVEAFHAGAFGGEIDLALDLTGGTVPAMEGVLVLTGADLGMLPSLGWEIGIASGTGDIRFALRSQGASERELVANLAGTVDVAAADGTLTGFSLGVLQARLGTVKDVAELNAVLQQAMTGGETPYELLNATGQVEGGVVTFESLAADLAFGSIEGGGAVDLPRRRGSLEMQFLFAEFPEAEDLGLSLSGPWDSPRRAIEAQALKAYIAARPPVVVVDADAPAAPAPLPELAPAGLAPAALAPASPAAPAAPLPVIEPALLPEPVPVAVPAPPADPLLAPSLPVAGAALEPAAPPVPAPPPDAIRADAVRAEVVPAVAAEAAAPEAVPPPELAPAVLAPAVLAPEEGPAPLPEPQAQEPPAVVEIPAPPPDAAPAAEAAAADDGAVDPVPALASPAPPVTPLPEPQPPAQVAVEPPAPPVTPLPEPPPPVVAAAPPAAPEIAPPEPVTLAPAVLEPVAPAMPEDRLRGFLEGLAGGD